MALVSPGVQVSVIDESFYTPAEPGTVPMIFVASAQDKTNSSGTGTAQGTTAATAGKVYLMTSQRELAETFGDPVFKTDANNNPINGGETNEYGLQAAYSYLGVANRAYVVRAGVDMGQLEATATAPAANPESGTYWFDTASSKFGIFEWNGASATTTGGQSFTNKVPHVITSATLLSAGVPKTSFGQAGDYAIVATTDANEMFYKKYDGNWVGVGTAAWVGSNPTVTGSTATAGYTGVIGSGTNFTITINGGATTITTSGTTVTQVAADIAGAGVSGLTARAVGGVLAIHYDGSNDADIILANGTLDIAVGLGIAPGTYYVPALQTAPHTSVPAYKTADAQSRPTGSLWVKTTTPNSGAKWSVKKFNGTTKLWEEVTAPIYETAEKAIYNLDRTGGGLNLAVGSLYIDHDNGTNALEQTILRRESTGSTKITGTAITTGITAGSKSFTIAESIVGQEAMNSAVTVSVSPTGAATDSDLIAGAINGSGFTNIVASVDASNRVSIEHNDGGEFDIVDTNNTLEEAGFTNYNYTTKAGTANLYLTAGGSRASNWKVLTYTASATAVTTTAADGQLWYSSIVDEVDIMYHNGTDWKGYSAVSSSDPAGPQVKSTAPTTQSDGTALVEGDLWISTADLENYPTIYKWNASSLKWVLVDSTDQTTENGILFADARFGTTGGTATVAPAGTIAELLASDFLDTDAPDPALYPKGMLLWNLRRSGFNVKRFDRNSIDLTALNLRMSDVSMASYYPHRWVTDSGNNEDGSGTFGRHAQRKSVTQALQAMVNGNTDIRDEESRQFNLMATPGYPELIGEMITLNTDRRLTAFVVGDTPFRLTPDATSLNNWGANVRSALEDNDNGAVSFDEYMGMYYPAGFTSDNAGNNVVVPASHMALRTMVLNDQVAFPWFAPAGTRRGGVSNATASGYITSEGEFKSVALNTGQRDTLYTNKINPITFLSGAGLVVFGQKTRARNASALDRVNVARLVVYLRGQLELLTKPYLFEPNDKITRDQIKAAADQLMLELVSLRALYDFVTVCDESNNTPARIDKNELYLDIAIEPVKAVEFIYIPLRLKNTGEIAGL